MKNWTLEELRSECRGIAEAFSAYYLKPAHVGFSFTELSLGEGYFSLYISVGGNIVEMDAVESFDRLAATVVKYKRLANKISEKDERERVQLASVLGVSP